MHPAYHLSIRGMDPCQHPPTALVLETTAGDRRMTVRLDPQEAESFDAECAGCLTLRARMGMVLALVLDGLAVSRPVVHLRRGLHGGLEAHLVLERSSEPLAVALNPVDALALARLRALTIVGDISLEPWLQPVEVAPAPLSPPIAAFLAALAPDDQGSALGYD